MDKSTVENTNHCIVNIAENSPIDRMNVQEHYFKDNFSNLSPRKEPSLLYSDVFYRFGLSIKRTGFRLLAQDTTSPGSFSSSICASPVLFAITMLARYALHLTSSLHVVVTLQTKWITPRFGGYFS
jgi:hypothetical protein